MATPYGFMVLPLFMASQHVYGVMTTRYQRNANAFTPQRHCLYTATPLRLRRKGDMKVPFFCHSVIDKKHKTLLISTLRNHHKNGHGLNKGLKFSKQAILREPFVKYFLGF